MYSAKEARKVANSAKIANPAKKELSVSDKLQLMFIERRIKRAAAERKMEVTFGDLKLREQVEIELIKHGYAVVYCDRPPKSSFSPICIGWKEKHTHS